MSQNTTPIDIPLPYNLTRPQIVLEPGDTEQSFDEAMSWFVDNMSWTDEEGCERVLRSTILLYHSLEGRVSLGACLHTALVWENG
jgi:hypothetical protein